MITSATSTVDNLLNHLHATSNRLKVAQWLNYYVIIIKMSLCRWDVHQKSTCLCKKWYRELQLVKHGVLPAKHKLSFNTFWFITRCHLTVMSHLVFSNVFTATHVFCLPSRLTVVQTRDLPKEITGGLWIKTSDLRNGTLFTTFILSFGSREKSPIFAMVMRRSLNWNCIIIIITLQQNAHTRISTRLNTEIVWYSPW